MSAKGRLWSRDETILVLDLYLRVGQVSVTHPDLLAVRARMAQVSADPAQPHQDFARSLASINLKLGNFTALDPNSDKLGLGNYSKQDEEIWKEFAQNPGYLPNELARICNSIPT